MKKILKRISIFLLFSFVLLNVIAYMQAYHFTHFTTEKVERTKDALALSWNEKLALLFLGVNNPRPQEGESPSGNYENVTIQSHCKLAAWYIPTENAKGTVILGHGYRAMRSPLLPHAERFRKMGYNTLLLSFQGSGESEGNETTIGWEEAEEVKDAYNYLVSAKKEKNIVLFGISMGAASILRAISVYDLQPSHAIIECPFATMYWTTCNRFRNMGVPAFPTAGLLVFWGGLQGGFNAFAHAPYQYADKVKVPTLLMYGEQDKNVDRAEIDLIFSHLKGQKKLVTFPDVGHQSYLPLYGEEWEEAVSSFISR